MEGKSRKEVAAKNALMTLFFQVVYLVVSFICRTVFTHVLGAEYLGLNGLFSNVLYVLSFLELGIGNAIVYKLYKPLSENNEKDICLYLSYYKRVYRLIMLFVGVVGVLVMPFLQYFVKTETVDADIRVLYLLFLIDTIISYAYVYKKSILIADQKNYVIEAYALGFNILINVFQIIVVVLTHAFVPYLVVKILFDLLCNVATARKADRIYPYINNVKSSSYLPEEDSKEFKENLKGLFMEKVASVSFGGTDNIFISLFCGLTMVGVVSQYTMILTAVILLPNKVFGALTSAVGKLNVESDGPHVEAVFRKLYFINAILYGLFFAELVNLLGFFVTHIWLTEEYILDGLTVFLVVLETCLRGMHYPVYMVRTAYGFFSQLRIMAVIGAIVNIILDIILGKTLGIVGIFIATIISRVFVSIVDLYVVYHYGFLIEAYKFIALWLKLIACITGVSALGLASSFVINISNAWIRFVVVGIVVAAIYIVGAVSIFRKNEEYVYFKNIIRDTANRLYRRG